MARSGAKEAEGKRAFAELRPACVKVMSSPSLESLAELRSKVEGLPVAIHPHLVDYVLLPLRTLFKRYGRLVSMREPTAPLFLLIQVFKIMSCR